MNNFCTANRKHYHIPMNTYSSLQSSTNSQTNFKYAYRDNEIQNFRYRRHPTTELRVMHSSLFSCFQADDFAFPVIKAFWGANITTKSLVFPAGVFLAHQQIISPLLCPYVYNNSTTCRKCQHLSIYKSSPSLSSVHHMKRILAWATCLPLLQSIHCNPVFLARLSASTWHWSQRECWTRIFYLQHLSGVGRGSGDGNFHSSLLPPAVTLKLWHPNREH